MSTASGRAAEDAAAAFFTKNGFRVIDRNWRSRWCEIDIIATKNKTVYFIEVKYRASNAWGSGLEYITPRKLQQMNFAAQLWLSQQSKGEECCLAAVAVSGDPPKVAEFVSNI